MAVARDLRGEKNNVVAVIGDGVIALRYPRGERVGCDTPAAGVPLEIGKGRIVRQGNRVAILALGTRLAEALKAAGDLSARGLSTTVADARFAKLLDRDLVARLAADHEVLITIEEGSSGGFGAMVLQFLTDSGALDRGGLKVRTMVLPDAYLDHDKPERLYAKAGLDAGGGGAGAGGIGRSARGGEEFDCVKKKIFEIWLRFCIP